MQPGRFGAEFVGSAARIAVLGLAIVAMNAVAIGAVYVWYFVL